MTTGTLYTVGDTAPTITGTVNADLSGASLVVNVARPDGTVFTHTGTATTPLAGKWSCTLAAGDLNQAGIYRVEVQVTYSDTTVQTFAFDTDEQFNNFPVRDQIG